MAFSDLIIFHFGYLERQIAVKNKHVRNIGIIKQALLVSPQDPFLLYSLGTEYFQCGRFLDAGRELESVLKLMRGDEGYFRNVIMSFGVRLYKTRQLKELVELADGCLVMFPDDVDLYCLKGIGALCRKRYRGHSGTGKSANRLWRTIAVKLAAYTLGR